MFRTFLKITLIVSVLSVFLYGDRLDDVKRVGVLKAGVKYDFKPFGFKQDGKVVGFDIDLLKYIATKLRVRLKLYQVTSKTRIPMVKANVVDIAAASMTHKQNRDIAIDFTIDYFFDGQSILARKDAREKSYRDYVGRKVGAIKGSSSGMNFFEKNPKADMVYFVGYNDALKALRSGQIDAITTDYVWCKTQADDSNGAFKTVGGTFTYEPYGMGVPENESNFRDIINFALQESVKDGTYEELYVKWFGEKPKRFPPVWPK